MEHYLQPIMDYLRLHPMMGMLLAFVIALIESLPVLGTVFPGSITMTAIGALVGAAILPATPTIICAIAGAFLGDFLGFWLGNRYHEKIRLIWPLNKLKKFVNYGENFFVKHGGKGIIIGRFIGPTRAAMPLIAGILRYPQKKFIPVALLASILWSLVYMAPGILLGALAMEFSHAEMSKVFLDGLAVIVALWLTFWLLQFFFKQLSRAINRKFQQCWEWLSQVKPGFLVRLIRNQQHPHDFHQLKILFMAVMCGILFLLVWFEVCHHGSLIQINQPLFYLLQSFRSPRMDKIWTLFTILGSPEALLAASLLAALGLAIYKQWRASTHLLLLGFISTGAIEVFKKIYFSARPAGLMVIDHTSSFPSGHTTMSVAVLGFLAFITARVIPRNCRWLLYTFFCLLIFLISISRLFLGQHWITDILGSWLLGLSILLFITLSYRRMPKTRGILRINKIRWMAIILLSVLLPWICAGWFTFKNILLNTQIVQPNITLNLNQWWQQPTQLVPLYRPDRLGKLGEPFNVQWAGNLADIQKFLLDHGWELAAKRSEMYSALARFTSHEPEFNMPLLPKIYRNKAPQAFFIKRLANSPDIIELRLWQSGVAFTDSTTPLWLGVLTYHIPPEKIFHFARRYFRLQSSNVLIYNQPQTDDSSFEIVNIPKEQQPEKIRAQQWDGNVFVIYTMPSNSH